MTHIEWNEALSLGIEKLDKQHAHVFELINALSSTAHRCAYKEMVVCFHKFREHAFYHFTDEEDIMRGIQYPKLEEHIHQHALLKKKIKYFQDILYRKELIPEQEIVDFLKSWLIGHILKIDMQIKDFLETTQRT
jgi:hemerythrin